MYVLGEEEPFQAVARMERVVRELGATGRRQVERRETVAQVAQLAEVGVARGGQCPREPDVSGLGLVFRRERGKVGGFEGLCRKLEKG